MRIYTKSGDSGETGLIGGTRVSKTDARICAIGEVDELNATLGMLRTYVSLAKRNTDLLLEQIQNDLFCLGAELAGSVSLKISEEHTHTLEKAIDAIAAKIPELKNFILPGGSSFAAHAHLARAVCRRAERAVVALNQHTAKDQQHTPLSTQITIYLNRLSDLLFMLAREDNFDSATQETPWKSA